MAPVRGGRPPHVGILLLFSIKNYDKPSCVRGVMVKNTFLIRTNVTLSHSGAAFGQTEVDLGSYTNLGSSKPEVLRIHSAHWYIQDSDGMMPDLGGNKAGIVSWQLATTSQTTLMQVTDDACLMGGQAGVRNGDSAQNPPSTGFTDSLLPQDLTAGQVVAVPSIFLGGKVGSEFVEDVNIGLILECTTEAMTKANAVALAISQQ